MDSKSHYDRVAKMILPLDLSSDPKEDTSLSGKVGFLLMADHEKDMRVSAIIESLTETSCSRLQGAFVDGDDGALLDVHKTLYAIYEASFSNPLSNPARNEKASWLIKLKDALETAWLDFEKSKIAHELPEERQYTDPEQLCAWFNEQAKQRTELDTWVADFLAGEATKEQFTHFVLADSQLNYRFYDALVLAAIHYSETVKAEISCHLWDEAGEGKMLKAHTQQFSRALEKLELDEPRIPVWRDWRPYAGYNLYLLFGLNRRHYFKGLGSLAMPELFDPERDAAVVKGLARLGYDSQREFEYFYNHMVDDVEHGGNWLDNVISPIVRSQPEAGHELALGAAMRMEAMRRYNEYLAVAFDYYADIRHSPVQSETGCKADSASVTA